MTYIQEQNAMDFTELSEQIIGEVNLQEVRKSTWN